MHLSGFSSLIRLFVPLFLPKSYAATINSQASIAETLCFHITPEAITMCAIQKDHTFSAYTQFLLVVFMKWCCYHVGHVR